MSSNLVFVDRRKKQNRRLEDDPCQEFTIDVLHKKRRTSTERRDTSRNIMDDYYAYMRQQLSKTEYYVDPRKAKKRR